MTPIHHTIRRFVPGLILTLLSAMMLLGSVQSVQAAREERPGSIREDRPAAAREERTGTMLRERPGPARQERPAAAPRVDRPVAQQREFRDTRYQHNRVYPARGHVVRALPREHRAVVHGGARYYFHGGVWYRPHGPRFTVVAPPFGLFVPFLPPFYATVWVSGRPYYYANDIYYANRGDGYVVVEPPQEPINQTPPPVVSVMPPEAQPIPVPPPPVLPMEKLFIYPHQNQSEQQQATDRYECHKWAVGQAGFDPTQLAGGPPDDQGGQMRADYQRAISACLEGRGYTVR